MQLLMVEVTTRTPNAKVPSPTKFIPKTKPKKIFFFYTYCKKKGVVKLTTIMVTAMTANIKI